MPRTKRKGTGSPAKVPPVLTREMAGRWTAWTEDGLTIVAIADSFEECERLARLAGYGPDQVAIDRVPVGRFRERGPSR